MQRHAVVVVLMIKVVETLRSFNDRANSAIGARNTDRTQGSLQGLNAEMIAGKTRQSGKGGGEHGG